MQRRLLASLVWVLGGLVLPSCEEASGATAQQYAIVGGVPSARKSVVALKNDLASGFCTATMVTHRVAVTAKHCVQRAGALRPDAPEHYKIYVGDNYNAPEAMLDVESLFAPPGVYTSQTSEEDGTLYGVDVGIVVLRRDAGLSTQPIRLEPLVNPRTRTFVTVGFGLTEDGNTASKREVALMATDVTTDRIIAGPVVCLGDSGGPLLQQEDGALVGVTSYGIGACGSGSSAFNTFSRVGELFEEALLGTSACLRDAHCQKRETCARNDSSIGRCQITADSSASEGGTSDAALNPARTDTVAGGACAVQGQEPHGWWYLLGVFALARRTRCPVASLQPTFRRQP